MDWRLVDDQWVNFSQLRRVWVVSGCVAPSNYPWSIWAESGEGREEESRDSFMIFRNRFNTKDEAQAFLNNFMKEHSLDASI